MFDRLIRFSQPPATRRGRIIAAIISSVLILVLVVIASSAWDRAFGSVTPTTSNTQVHPRMPAREPGQFVHTGTRKYRHHKLDNSVERKIPTIAYNHLEHYKNHHPAQTAWWRHPLHTGECMLNAVGSPLSTPWDALCLVYGENPTWTSLNNRIQKVRVICGGSAIVGFLGKGGMWGAVRGSALCAFEQGYEVYSNWAHQRRVHLRQSRMTARK